LLGLFKSFYLKETKNVLDRNKVYLVQTDTTVGFLSNDPYKLSLIKQRDPKQKILRTVDSFKTLQQQVRVPNRFKNKIRKSQKTTFIYPNGDSYRVVDRDNLHQNFLKKFTCLYSTSANITKQEFNEEFAMENGEIIVFTKKGFNNTNSSKIYKLGKSSMKRIR